MSELSKEETVLIRYLNGISDNDELKHSIFACFSNLVFDIHPIPPMRNSNLASRVTLHTLGIIIQQLLQHARSSRGGVDSERMRDECAKYLREQIEVGLTLAPCEHIHN